MKQVIWSGALAVSLAISAHGQSAAAAGASPAVTHLAQAIQYPTVSFQDRGQIDYSQFRAFRQFLEQTYPLTFSTLQVETVADYSLLLTWPGSEPVLKPVLLDSHYDVVPIEPGTEQDWTHPPFSGAVSDGFLWGRGALDDKASVIATLEAVEALLRDGFQPQRTLLFSLAHDEEIGGTDGAANIVRHLQDSGITLQYMIAEGGLIIAGNPLLPERDMAMIGLAEKTYVTLTLMAKGEGGHSSMPVQDNAIVRLSRALTRLHDNPFDTQLGPPVSDMLQIVGAELGGLKGFMLKNQWLSKPLLLSTMARDPLSNAMIRTTTAVTMFDAGIKENVISQQAEAKVNFRLMPGFTTQQLIDGVREIIDDGQIEIEAQQWKPGPPVADINGEGYQRVKSAINAAYPQALVVPSLLTATTDSAHYVEVAPQIYRFHPFSLHVSDAGTIHSTNERIAVEAVERSVRISRALVESAARR
ncbi:M20/M25/M40 family metallo-hydrolase [Seongchinamella sediminis]|uniref:M20/M25/M40 family metallo-hydrolase n=1 Tax=Seongchinamella sediminis TaxID=2283635 RepID=A0A3L7DZN1_9GAMM|nr:M20/M25/M40 family metallo-hydrolase [Seongchinamella sediminis]RLQ22706.1 M20/M25/M40 family metallo-hydrolase [Seongchinamella sediminis]